MKRNLQAIGLIGFTLLKTFGELSKRGLGLFIPLVLLLFLLSVLLFLLSAVTPLAPFVYSLI